MFYKVLNTPIGIKTSLHIPKVFRKFFENISIDFPYYLTKLGNICSSIL